MSPQKLFRVVAVAEAITWAALLTGMFLKYVTETTELGVRFGGMAHGVVFIGYCLTAVLVGVDQRWPLRRTLVGLLAAVPPFVTVWFDLSAERKGWFATAWRLRQEEPRSAIERLASLLLRNPLRGLVAGVVAVLALTGVALLVGPPAG